MERKHNGKIYDAIIGFLKGGGSETQALRYPKKSWTEGEARAHCKEAGGSFEAAREVQEMDMSDPDNNPMIKTEVD
jgi:hypothetical protein